MDWVRGRPPDALLCLKALLKASTSGLSVSQPFSSLSTATATTNEDDAGVDVSRTSTLGSLPAAAARIAGGLGAPDGLGNPAPRNSSSNSIAAGMVLMPSPAAALAAVRDAAGGCEDRTVGDASSPSIVAAAGVEVLTPRTLAEGALLAPLRDVGTVAGALRSGVGSSLREMAAARLDESFFSFPQCSEQSHI